MGVTRSSGFASPLGRGDGVGRSSKVKVRNPLHPTGTPPGEMTICQEAEPTDFGFWMGDFRGVGGLSLMAGTIYKINLTAGDSGLTAGDSDLTAHEAG